MLGKRPRFDGIETVFNNQKRVIDHYHDIGLEVTVELLLEHALDPKL